MRRLAVSALLALIPAAFAQPSFDVASIRVNPIPDRFGVGPIENTADSVTARGVSLWMCLRWAYDLENSQISAPGWMQSPPFYDIAAKASGPVPRSELRVMLQSLLADRFHLSAHIEKTEMPVLALIVARGGAKFQKSAGTYDPDLGPEAPFQFLGYDNTVHIQARPDTGNRIRFSFTNVSMTLFVALLELAADRSPYDKLAVVDMTGLPGRFDFAVSLELVSHEGGAASPSNEDEMDSWKRALPTQLGLTLESRKATVNITTVDHIDKTPTAN